MKIRHLGMTFLYFLYVKIVYECLNINKTIRKYHFSIPGRCRKSLSLSHHRWTKNNSKYMHEKRGEKKHKKEKENKFLVSENDKKISINPLFNSLCKHVSVSETCLYNVQQFFNQVNRDNTTNKEFNENRNFCGILYGTYQDDKSVKIENVFFSLNISKQNYDVEYLLHSEDRKRADLLAKLLNLEIVGFLYSYPDIGIDLSESNKKKKDFIRLNKKMKTLNDEENEVFIPMGGKEVLLSLMVMKQLGDNLKKREKSREMQDRLGSEIQGETRGETASYTAVADVGDTKKKRSVKKKKDWNVKPFITLSVGMNKNTETIVVEAYEINNDLMKLIKNDIVKDMEKQNSILHFEKKEKERENEMKKKIKSFDSEIDLMNELFLKCKKHILIKKIALKKIDILFCVNNVPIFSHQSFFNYFFPYPNNSNYYTILQTFNNMIKSLHNKKDIINIFRDFNFLFFLTNIFSMEHDFPCICAAVNNTNSSPNIPDQYVQILRSLSKSASTLM
ncbi:conserved Plasmodium protein, unknown function [Plasmodium ovale]|uniref:JAB1/MPN/MOV34 metalloenzyme domain-containing protein n=2 Tax=Plasmodium ovale TaxID=36330 RepID=A0A1A8VQB7_PLAOA|nr:conserved Plasmodium protein, unknown function [Plasmodium ovale curtisi]SBS84033.1 conserved Plasmodium protein, unknown function [Plasmodium ovale curtisi]SCP03871.1 conserved Plasmodium protein, unknown function [Plasmodium ovale]